MYATESKKHDSFNELSVKMLIPILNKETTIEKLLQKNFYNNLWCL